MTAVAAYPGSPGPATTARNRRPPLATACSSERNHPAARVAALGPEPGAGSTRSSSARVGAVVIAALIPASVPTSPAVTPPAAAAPRAPRPHPISSP